MVNFATSIGGLRVAGQMIELLGTNITNAATEGYHRQEALLSPIEFQSQGKTTLGGVEIQTVRRLTDVLLEQQITREHSELGGTLQELGLLEMVETLFGEVGSGGLETAMNQFIASYDELAADPDSLPLRSQVVWSADNLARQLRSAADSISNLSSQIISRVNEYMNRANSLIERIGELSIKIGAAIMRGGSGNLLQDQRDLAINELADLVDLQVFRTLGSPESLQISAWGKAMLVQSESGTLISGLDDDGKLGVAMSGSPVYDSTITTGRIGALVNLKNNILAGVLSDLNALAAQVISAVNRYHVQGVGSGGGFTELNGMSVPSGTIDTYPIEVTAGDFYVCVTETSTGEVTRHAITVDPGSDTLSDIATSLNALTGLSASTVGTVLRIASDPGYTFDFRPALMSGPYTSAITGTSTPTISGIYTGTANQNLTCTVSGTGQVGISADLFLEVRDGAGEVLKRVGIGTGYGPADELEVGLGVRVSLSPGQLNDGDQFTIQCLADADPTGFLKAVGINTLFTGSSAMDIGVAQRILDQPGKLAVAVGADGTDSANVVRMSQSLGLTATSLGGSTPQVYLRNIITEVGQNVDTLRIRKESIENVMQQLTKQRDDISGVDINQEAAKLVAFERMFQGMAKVIAVQNDSLQYLFDLI